MTDAMILGGAGSFLGVCGITIAAIITRHKGNGPVNVKTCEAKHEGLIARHESLNKSLDALWKELRAQGEKTDRILLLIKG